MVVLDEVGRRAQVAQGPERVVARQARVGQPPAQRVEPHRRRAGQDPDAVARPDRVPVLHALGVVPHAVAVDEMDARGRGDVEHAAVDVRRNPRHHRPRAGCPGARATSGGPGRPVADEPVALPARSPLDVGPGPLHRPPVLVGEPVELRAALPVPPRQIEGVLHPETALLWRVDEEQPPERRSCPRRGARRRRRGRRARPRRRRRRPPRWSAERHLLGRGPHGWARKRRQLGLSTAYGGR